LKLAIQWNEKAIIFTHHPLLAVASEPIHLLWNCEEVLKILDKYNNIVLHICGHYHPGGYSAIKHFHSITLQSILEAASNAYGIIDVYDNRLELRGFGIVPSRTLLFERNDK